jgi:hypothetical protein
VRRAAEADRPRVFLSFAGTDRGIAERLGNELADAGIDAFVDQQVIEPGRNFVLAMNHALTQSDYYVLLWSRASVDRPWVDVEWTAALTRELSERRSFLFVLRLDNTPTPLLLAPRFSLDAYADWDRVVAQLVSTWRRDWSVRRSGFHVLPAPDPGEANGAAGEGRAIVLYVRNRDLSVEHVLAVSEASTGRQLDDRVHAALMLQDSVTGFDGTVGLRFSYQLKYGDQPISPVRTLMDLGVTDGATVELEVQVEPFGPTGSSAVNTYRGDSPIALPPGTTRLLIRGAFGHLIPW